MAVANCPAVFFYITGHLSVGEADTAYNWELNTLTWRI